MSKRRDFVSVFRSISNGEKERNESKKKLDEEFKEKYKDDIVVFKQYERLIMSHMRYVHGVYFGDSMDSFNLYYDDLDNGGLEVTLVLTINSNVTGKVIDETIKRVVLTPEELETIRNKRSIGPLKVPQAGRSVYV